jgi:hypothetical protein
MKKHSVITLAIFLSLPPYLSAQSERAPMLTRNQLLWISPNIESSNAAALSSLYLELPEFRSVSDAELILNYNEGKLRSPRIPKSEHNLMFSTKSVQRFDQTFVSAYFNYGFQNLNDVQWYNSMSGELRTNLLNDSIPGTFTSERLFTGVKVGHKFNDKHTIGVAMNYSIGTGAKSIDIRNLNRIMRFDISPSWMFYQEWGNIGADIGFRRSIEHLTYRQQVTEGPLTIFRMEGLWFFHGDVMGSGEINRFIEEATYMANLKVDLKVGSMKWYNQFGAEYTDGFIKLRQTVTQEEFGDQEALKYTYRTTLKINPQNQIRVNFQNNTLLAYSLIQRSQINPQTRMTEFRTFGRNKHYSEVRNSADFTYAYASMRNGNPVDQAWRLEIGGSYFQRVQAQRRFPFLFQQTINIYEGFASFNKNIPTNRFIFDIKPNISFAKGNGTMNDVIKLEPNTTRHAPVDVQMLPQLKHEFDYLTATKFGVGLEATVAYPIRENRQTALFLTARANHRQALDTDLNGFSRTYVSLHFGLKF